MSLKNNCVLHVITSINRGGAENHLVDLVRGQISNNYKVGVAYLKGSGYWEDELRSMGADVYPLRLSYYGEVGPCLRLRKIILSMSPCVVHAHMPPAEIYSTLAMVNLNYSPRYIVSKHNDEPFYNGIGWRLIGSLITRRSNHVIAISDAVNSYVRKLFNLTEDRITTIRYGVDISLYTTVLYESIYRLRKEWGFDSSALLVGTVARLVPQKALHILIQGFAQFKYASNCDAKLVIVGQGSMEGELKSLAVSLGISDSIYWAGFREDIQVVMASFDIFALTSIYEGFGLVLLEAMASSKPIIASNVSAIPEIVVDGKTGILIPPLNPDKLAEALISLESEDKRKALGRAGFERASLDYSLIHMVNKTIKVYDIQNY